MNIYNNIYIYFMSHGSYGKSTCLWFLMVVIPVLSCFIREGFDLNPCGNIPKKNMAGKGDGTLSFMGFGPFFGGYVSFREGKTCMFCEEWGGTLQPP